MKLHVPLLTGLLLLAAATAAWSHHSQTMYDETKMVTLTGVVTRFAWVNPHTKLFLDVTASGKTANWEIETNAAVSLAKLGWTRTEFQPGDKVTVTVNPAKDGSAHGMLRKAVLPNGKTMEMGGNGPQKPR
jgi:Family of unknown function (DUF6152)